MGGLLLFVDSLEFLRPFSLAVVLVMSAESEVSELLLRMLLASLDDEEGCSLLVQVAVAVLLVLELDGFSCPKMALS